MERKMERKVKRIIISDSESSESSESDSESESEPESEPESDSKMEPLVKPNIVIKQEELIAKYSECTEFSKPCNELLNEKELLEESILRDSDQNTEYPNLNDPNFNAKIASKLEFSLFKYNGTIQDLEEYSDKLSKLPFELSPHQYFIKNFLSPSTPYNSILLFHGLGTGKTCSAIGIAEEERDFIKNMNSFKPIIIVATPNVQENFMLQLFNENDLKNEDGYWTSSSCVGNKFIQEVNPTNIKDVSKAVIRTQIKGIISKYYKFMGYEQFSSKIEEFVASSDGDKMRLVKSLQKYFDGRLIIFDEIHHASEDTEKKNISKNLMLLVKLATIKMVLLTATPMFNTCKEIIWIINLMNLNDKRSKISSKDVFTDDNEFIDYEGDVGKKLLLRKSRGYVSYVRSDNPYIFPFRIYPYVFAPDHTFLSKMEVIPRESVRVYPTRQLNDVAIEKQLDTLGVYLDKIGSYQSIGYHYIIENMKSRPLNTVNKRGDEIKIGDIMQMTNFNYTVLQAPLQALNIIYPYDLLTSEPKYGGGPNLHEMLNEIQTMPYKEMSSNKVFKSANDLLNVQMKDNTVVLNTTGGGPDFTRLLIGSKGLERVMDFDNTDTVKGNFRYKQETLDKYGRIFSQDNIGNYSCKIKNICENINTSTGIILVYSQYIDSGIIPMALALEEMGFGRYNGKNLFASGAPSSRKKYVMITGSVLLSPNNVEEYNAARSEKNINGDVVKVILVSSAGSEGLDFKCIRQVHIMEPWYNMSKIEQVLGRAIRNFSHKLLPFLERNVQIFLHSTILENEDVESVDLYMYRRAEQKAKKIGKVTRLLKENAIDCLLNSEQLNFKYENFQGMKVTQLLSDGKVIEDLTVGDVPYSSNCDYQESCDYSCGKAPVVIDEIVDYKGLEKLNEIVIKTILHMFKLEHFYELKDFLHKFTINQINFALTKLIDDEVIIYDKYNRAGKIVNVNKYYLFQPIELEDKRITIFERTVPIDVKMQGIVFDIENVRKPKRYGVAEESTEEKLLKLILSDKEGLEIADKDIELSEKELGRFSQKPQILIDAEIEFNNVQRLSNYPANIDKSNWYQNCAVAIHQMTTNAIMSLEELNEYLIDHIIDCMLYRNKRVLFYYLIEKQQHSPFELLMLEGFRRNINNDHILLYDNETLKNKMFVFEDGGVRDAHPEDVRKRKRVEKVAQKYIGFIDPLSDYVFKIRDNSNSRSSGLKCANYNKQNLLKLLNSISTYEYNTKYDAKLLCIFLEMFMRKNKMFYTVEEAVEFFSLV